MGQYEDMRVVRPVRAIPLARGLRRPMGERPECFLRERRAALGLSPGFANITAAVEGNDVLLLHVRSNRLALFGLMIDRRPTGRDEQSSTSGIKLAVQRVDVIKHAQTTASVRRPPWVVIA